MPIPHRPLRGSRHGWKATEPTYHVVTASRYLKTHARAKQTDPRLSILGGQMLQGKGAKGVPGTMCHVPDHARRH
ncbi:hypothetical protein GCM10010343_46170 [Streptomyces avidinii]|uniref:Uncharacterized protein n=1 Tax=Streptomyces avidinii TaxID=1895 RepID=A0ABS4L832_STRAV|nr:hypothetical protein [Streptomyces avidinii]GGZ13994.1 hypothetical protein GCM10010343_46170 [Streptomyces avidinii]